MCFLTEKIFFLLILSVKNAIGYLHCRTILPFVQSKQKGNRTLLPYERNFLRRAFLARRAC
jgi:hypothetical protein